MNPEKGPSRREVIAGIGAVGAALAFSGVPQNTEAHEQESWPFKLRPEPLSEGHMIDAWSAVNRSIKGNEHVLNECLSKGRCTPETERMKDILNKVAGLEGWSKINHLSSELDQVIRLQTPVKSRQRPVLYWHAPLDAFRQENDCKGYAVLKYFAFGAIGISTKDRMIFVVEKPPVTVQGEQNRRIQTHAVVLVRMGREWKVIDNESVGPVKDSDYFTHARARGKPIYALNEEGVWRFPDTAAL